MPYMRNNLISRAGYSGYGCSGMGDWWDSITSAAGSALSIYGSAQQAQGAAQQANRDVLAAMQAQQGPGIGTIMLIGGGVLAAVLLMRKKG